MKAALILMRISAPVALLAQATPVSSLGHSPHASYLIFASALNSCEEGRQLAERDIAEKSPCLLLAGGIAPIVFATDKNFENEFGVRYLENGCSGPATACAAAYDARIFQYLTENFGRTWQKKVRKDVLGFKEWKRTN